MPPTKASKQDTMGTIMRCLGNPVRLHILRQLATPRQVGEIKVAPHRKEQGHSPRRSMSRASVQAHLEQLIQVGAVRALSAIRDGRSVTLYAVDRRQLFALTQELHDLARMQSPEEAVSDGTAPAPTAPAVLKGPRMTFINGPWEGQDIPLTGEGPWSIGRAAANDISMPYDPYLSSKNSEIHRGEFTYSIRNLASARNGTSLNWEVLNPEAPASIVPGDVIGVGRTLLLFRRD
jgi:DNA-binding transcriptional ArsR family regulator